jgi:hypothetical protein
MLMTTAMSFFFTSSQLLMQSWAHTLQLTKSTPSWNVELRQDPQPEQSSLTSLLLETSTHHRAQELRSKRTLDSQQQLQKHQLQDLEATKAALTLQLTHFTGRAGCSRVIGKTRRTTPSLACPKPPSSPKPMRRVFILAVELVTAFFAGVSVLQFLKAAAGAHVLLSTTTWGARLHHPYQIAVLQQGNQQ